MAGKKERGKEMKHKKLGLRHDFLRYTSHAIVGESLAKLVGDDEKYGFGVRQIRRSVSLGILFLGLLIEN